MEIWNDEAGSSTRWNEIMATEDFITKHAPATVSGMHKLSTLPTEHGQALQRYQPLVDQPDIDTRGMYYGDVFTSPEISQYAEDIGTLGNLRHATSSADWKNKIAQAITPGQDIGIKPGIVANTIGGIGANVLGLGHEFKGLTEDWSQIKDPNWWRATGEDVIANLYGTVKGKTGVSDQEIYDSMLTDFISDEGIMGNILNWGTIPTKTSVHDEKPGMALEQFRNIYEMKKNKQKLFMQKQIQQAEAASRQRAERLAQNKALQHAARQRSTPGYGSAPGGQGFDAGTGRTTTSGYSGRTGQKEMMADGGLAGLVYLLYGGRV